MSYHLCRITHAKKIFVFVQIFASGLEVCLLIVFYWWGGLYGSPHHPLESHEGCEAINQSYCHKTSINDHLEEQSCGSRSTFYHVGEKIIQYSITNKSNVIKTFLLKRMLIVFVVNLWLFKKMYSPIAQGNMNQWTFVAWYAGVSRHPVGGFPLLGVSTSTVLYRLTTQDYGSYIFFNIYPILKEKYGELGSD